MADDIKAGTTDPRDEDPAAQPPPAVPAVTSQGQPQRFRDDAGYDPVTQTGAGAGAQLLQPPEQDAQGSADLDQLQPVDEGTPRSIVRRDAPGEEPAPTTAPSPAGLEAPPAPAGPEAPPPAPAIPAPGAERAPRPTAAAPATTAPPKAEPRKR